MTYHIVPTSSLGAPWTRQSLLPSLFKGAGNLLLNPVSTLFRARPARRGTVSVPTGSFATGPIVPTSALGAAWSRGLVIPTSSLGAWEWTPMQIGIGLLCAIGGAIGAYHGYGRHGGSWKWAILWSLLGTWAPFLAIPVALYQGIGKPMRAKNKSKRSKKSKRAAKRLERQLARVFSGGPRARIRVAGRKVRSVGTGPEVMR